MTINEALEILLKLRNIEGEFAVGIARAGSDNPVIKCSRIGHLIHENFGEPLHVLVVLAKKLHFMEVECLQQFANAPKELEKLIE